MSKLPARRLKNVTVTLDEDTFASARVRAAEGNLSLSRFISDVLRRELQHEGEYEAAYRAWLARKLFPLRGPSQPYPRRQELHDRAALRLEDATRRKAK